MDVKLPDGTIISNVPEGTTQTELMTRVGKMRAAQQVASDPITQGAQNFNADTGFMQNAAAGAGKALTDIGRGAAQLTPWGPSREEIDAIKKRDAPLMNTGGGITGNIAGNVAALLPAAAIPGVNTVAGGAALGAAAGAMSPVGTEDSRVGNATTGAVLGGGIPLAIKAAKGVGGVVHSAVESATEGGRTAILDRFQRDLAGNARPQLAAALRDAQQIVPGSSPTAGEAIAAIPESTALAAHQKAIAKAPVVSGAFETRADANEAARKAALGQIAQTPQALATALKERSSNAAENYGAVANLRVNPKSDVQIMQDAIAGRASSADEALRDWWHFANTEVKNIKMGENFVPVPGMPRVSGRASNFPERAAEASSAAHETKGIQSYRLAQEFFLKNAMDSLENTVGLDNKALSDFVSRPSMKSAIQDALLSAQESGKYFPAAKGEQFSVANLQRVKESLDAGIAASKRAIDAGRRPELSPAELEGTRKQFIAWLSNKVPGWADARQQFAADSKPINQMQIGQYLQDKLAAPLGGTERAASYAQALRDAPGTIKRSTGAPMYDKLGQVLEPAQEHTATAVGADLARQAQYGQRAAGTNITGASNVAEAMQPRLPNLLSRPAMILNALMKHLGYNAEDKINKLAGERYLNPQLLAEALKDVPPRQRSAATSLIMQLRNPAMVGATVPEATQP